MARYNPVEAVLRRDRWVLIGALAALSVIAAIYTVFGVGMDLSAVEMTAMADPPPIAAPGAMGAMAMAPAAWTPGYFALVFLMWWVMMIAMMTPAAAPLILLHAAIRRKQEPSVSTMRSSAVFLAGYLAVWAAFGLAAAGLQWQLELRGMVSPSGMTVSHHVLAGVILLGAGAYQFTKLKHACLRLCRNPIIYLSEHYRSGYAGAFRMGAEHGLYCLGCCWSLMALLFFGGIMNLYWIIGLALLVLVERLLPRGDSIGLGVGAVLMLWGVLFLATAIGIA